MAHPSPNATNAAPQPLRGGPWASGSVNLNSLYFPAFSRYNGPLRLTHLAPEPQVSGEYRPRLYIYAHLLLSIAFQVLESTSKSVLVSLAFLFSHS